MDFKNAKELLELCQKLSCPISDIMKQRECTLAGTSREEMNPYLNSTPSYP